MMKLIAVTLLMTLACAVYAVPPAPAYAAEPMCEVQVCNKLERFSLSISRHLKDHFGETCFGTRMPKSEALPGKVLDSTSKWYQGSVNLTKQSVTRIKSVGACH